MKYLGRTLYLKVNNPFTSDLFHLLAKSFEGQYIKVFGFIKMGDNIDSDGSAFLLS